MKNSTPYSKSQATPCPIISNMKLNENDLAFSTTKENFTFHLNQTVIESIEPGFLSNSNGIKPTMQFGFSGTGIWYITEEVFRSVFEMLAIEELETNEGHNKWPASGTIDFGFNPLRLFTVQLYNFKRRLCN